MPKKNLDEFVISDTGNWNVADKYSLFKIMKPLYYADLYADIAFFGSSDLFEELTITNINVDELKIKAFQRLIRTLLTLINNSIFACKREKDTLEKLKVDLLNIEKILPNLYKTNFNAILKIKQLVIIPKYYNAALEAVLNIKSAINEPLNKNHLIFTDKEEFDPHAFKESIRSSIINKG